MSERPEQRQERGVFTEEFKRDAVRLAKERGNIFQAARDLGVHESVLSRWKRQMDASPESPFPGQGNPQDPELAHRNKLFSSIFAPPIRRAEGPTASPGSIRSCGPGKSLAAGTGWRGSCVKQKFTAE
ncbi:MAG: transposase [Armatimonadetes bacterium]|nr:transposase [Armatimonadota bacterium]